MNKLILSTIIAASVAIGASTAEAKSDHHKHGHDRHDHHGRHDRDEHRHHYSDHTRTIYVIENRRPVRRVVYVNPGGGYYRVVDGRRVIVRERYYTSYPSRYFYPDGRRRVGISFSF